MNFIKEIEPFAYYWIVENELGNTKIGIDFNPPPNYLKAMYFPLYTQKQIFDAVKLERDACAQILERIDLGAFKDNINAKLWFEKMLMDLANAVRTRDSMSEAEKCSIFRTETFTTTTLTATSSLSNATDQHN